MTIFMQMVMIALIVSNLLLWMVCKGLQIRLKSLAEKIVELSEYTMQRSEE